MPVARPAAALVAGVDVGSTAAKAVVLHGASRAVLGVAVTPTGWNPRETGQAVLHAALREAGTGLDAVARVVGTGYGRISLPFLHRTVTEITCHARGAHHLAPDTRTVLDVGGQDSKVVAVDERGNVRDFVMNDKCAAGTGRFLQVMTGVLDMTLDEMGDAALRGTPVPLNSMCAVFAETEVIGLIAQGVSKDDLAASIVASVARRLKALTGRVPLVPGCAFTGGLATNPAFARIFSETLGLAVTVSRMPQATGALGAALIAAQDITHGGAAG